MSTTTQPPAPSTFNAARTLHLFQMAARQQLEAQTTKPTPKASCAENVNFSHPHS
jgi:hypothetical protein